jgi:rubrerythrin
MSSIKGTKTEQNLLKAFAGESQARMRYNYYASVAKKEGLEQISALFEEQHSMKKNMQNAFLSF